MRKFRIFLFISFSALLLAACIKNKEVVFTGGVVEFDAASWNANAVGVTYPILTRVPPFSRAVSTTIDPALTKNSGTIKVRVNLVGPQKSTDTEVTYEVVSASTTAVAGVHYAALPGKVIIPANSSFGDISIQILSPTTTPPPSSVDLVLQLNGGTGLPANPNYNKVGLRIAQ